MLLQTLLDAIKVNACSQSEKKSYEGIEYGFELKKFNFTDNLKPRFHYDYLE